MRVVGAGLGIPRVKLQQPNGNGYVLLAAEVKGSKCELLKRVKRLAVGLAGVPGVAEAGVFDTLIFAPSHGKKLLEKAVAAGRLKPARFDLVVLVRTATPEAAKELVRDARYGEMKTAVESAAGRVYQAVAENARRIDEVAKNGVFLFNYFYAEDPEQLLPVWEYTPGWFTAKTSLRNSTVLRPLTPSEYGIINHASWPSLLTFLPHLIFRPTFRSYVLANFEANGIAAQPIIYRRV